MWKYLYPGHRRSCSPPSSPTVHCAESAFWSFPECDNYRKRHNSLPSEHQAGALSCLFFHGKLKLLLTSLWKLFFFRKVKTLRQLCNLRLVSSFNRKEEERKKCWPREPQLLCVNAREMFSDYSFVSEETAVTTCNTACLQSWQEGLSRACGENHSPFSQVRWVSALEFSKLSTPRHTFCRWESDALLLFYTLFICSFHFFLSKEKLQSLSDKIHCHLFNVHKLSQAKCIWPGFRCDCF